MVGLNRSKVIPVLALLFAGASAFLSFELLAKHLAGTSRSAWFEAGCSEDSAIGGNCAAVLASRYSSWPPKRPDEPRGTPHVPVAFLGLVYYSVLSIWLVGIGRPSYARRHWHLIPLGLSSLGLLSSAYFVMIMFTRINEWCLWCLVTHVLNFLLAVCLWLMWPRAAASAPEPTATGPDRERILGPAARDVHGAAHPSGRLVMMTFLAVWLVMFGQLQFLGHSQTKKREIAYQEAYAQCSTVLQTFAADSDALYARWRAGETHDVPVRSDDPVRWPDRSVAEPIELVVFSDFECPSCKRLARFLEGEVQPLFDGQLKMVFKHYPLNLECNPVSTSRMHAHACEAAMMAEAARTLGGSRAFWLAHDFIFAEQERLKQGELTADSVAEELHLDPKRFEELMRSEAAVIRIGEDARVGKNSGLSSTPAVFVSGRLVTIPARDAIRFWDKLADHYWKSRNEARPPSTELAVRSATPGSPDPSAAP